MHAEMVENNTFWAKCPILAIFRKRNKWGAKRCRPIDLRVVEWVALIKFLFGMCHYKSTLDFNFFIFE